MAQRTSSAPYSEDSPYYEEDSPYYQDVVQAFDEDAGDSRSFSFRAMPSIGRDFLPDDPVPLFLSDHPVEPPAFGRIRARPARSRILKMGIVSLSAAALIAVTLSLGSPITIFGNAAASLVGIPAAQSGSTAGKPDPEPMLARQPAGAGQSAPVVQSVAAGVSLSPTARSAPSRGEIVAAFKVAHQSQTEIIQPTVVQPPVVAPPPRRLEADDVAALLKRARSLIAIGDIAPARLLLERAADAQEAGAALLLAQTYDPAVLGAADMRSITPDLATARGWYLKAATLGSLDAQRRLDQIQN
jgi:hypothetical protein